MKNSFFSQAMTVAATLLLASAGYAQSTDVNPTTSINPSTPGSSKVRIVRLSQVKGAVEIDRHIGRGFEKAIANLPVVEQSQVRTGVGIAEIEFEDNSSLRVAPNSLVEFPRLEREASGATASTVHLIQGSAYISLVKAQSGKEPANQFELMFGARKLDLDPATHVRLELTGTQAKLAVFDGTVHVDGDDGAMTIAKKKTATFQIFDKNEPTVAKDIATSPFDTWDHESASYHSNAATFSAFNSPYSYGLSDMSYYGSFMNAGGCGSMWRPYFASAGWDPFANGTWAYYPGSGYSWVSPYPWAWTPYHSGSWSYCPSTGWGWMPGGDWYGLNNVAALQPFAGNNSGTIPRTPIGGPHVPLRPPLASEPALIAVNTKALSTSEIASPTSFVFRKDSAGLGVPRETLGKLDKFSHETDTRGAARTPIFTSLPQTNRPNGSMSTAESMATSIHRGSAPPPSPSSQESYSSAFGGLSNANAGSVRSTSTPSAPVASAPSSSRK